MCNARQSSTRNTKGRLQQASDRAPKTSYDTMQFLEEVVLPSINNAGTDIDRPPIWASQYLTEPTATNATFKEYRKKVGVTVSGAAAAIGCLASSAANPS